jgi:gamma-glutamyl hydrolase
LATQWHPEKPPYEFADRTIPHSRTAIAAAAETAGLFVDIARLNAHSIPYQDQLKLVINNYERHFVAGEGPSDEDDPLPDTLWFIPEPRRAREDPESPAGPEKVVLLSRKGGMSDGSLLGVEALVR